MSLRSSLISAAAILTLCCASALPMPAAKADDLKDARSQAEKAAKVFQEVMDTPDKGIPRDLLDNAQCVAVFPSVVKAAFIVGGKGGRGVVSCRDTRSGAWSAPVFLKLAGGSFGFQIGAEATDLVLVGVNKSSVDLFRKDKFQIGAEAQAAAGPVGRDASASTSLPDPKAELLSYSRSRGAFAGLALNGSVINRDHDLNAAVYGPQVSTGEIMSSSKAPEGVSMFQDTLNRYAPGPGRR